MSTTKIIFDKCYQLPFELLELSMYVPFSNVKFQLCDFMKWTIKKKRF